MADNLKLLQQDVETVLNENGAPGSILALEHKGFVKDMLVKVGKYSSWFFVAKKTSTANVSGVMNFNSNAFNNTADWILTVAKLTADLNDIGETLKAMSKGDLIFFKDYVGRTAFFVFQSYEATQDAGFNDVYDITVKGLATNINYTYQDTESEICSLAFKVLQDNKFKAINFGTVQIALDGSVPIASKINALTDNSTLYKTCEGNQVPLFYGLAKPIKKNQASFEVAYVVLNYGRGTYGVNGDIVLTSADLYPIKFQNSGTTGTPPIVTNDPNAFVFDLGEIPSGDFLNEINTEPFPYYDLTDPNVNYYFEFTVGGDRVLYGFDGVLGLYGDTQLQMVDTDVFLVYDERSPNLFPYDLTGINNGDIIIWNDTNQRFEPTSPGGGGDMLASVYDPANKSEQVLTIGDKGVANGVASLDGSGKVPTGQLPSYVDDVVEGYLDAGIFYEDVGLTTPIVGEISKIYIDLLTEDVYRFTGSVYVKISDVLSGSEIEALLDAYYGNTNWRTVQMDNMVQPTVSKTTPVDADTMTIWDSASAFIAKKVSWSNIKATLKTYFDTLYASITHTHNPSDVKDRLEENTGVTGAKNIDWNAFETFKFIVTGATTWTDTNLTTAVPAGKSKVITLDVTGNFAITFPTGWNTNMSGTYDGTLKNTIVVEYFASATPFFRVDISQPD